MTSYCDYCISHLEDTFNRVYHDTQYRFPLQEGNLLFERLMLEINQAGLSWITILKKADNFRKAYHGFDIDFATVSILIFLASLLVIYPYFLGKTDNLVWLLVANVLAFEAVFFFSRKWRSQYLRRIR